MGLPLMTKAGAWFLLKFFGAISGTVVAGIAVLMMEDD